MRSSPNSGGGVQTRASWRWSEERTRDGGATAKTVNQPVASTTGDKAFRWDATNQRWIFNISTTALKAGSTYIFDITLNDGSHIGFQFTLK